MKYLFIIVLIFFSCNTTRHWKKVASDQNVTPEKRAIIAPKVAAMFPPEIIFIEGKETVRIDSIMYDESLNVIITDTVNKVDTVIKTRVKQITRVITKRDTLQIVNTAQLSAVQRELATANTVNASLEADQRILKDKLKASRKWLWLFIAACVIILGYGVMKIYSKFKG